MNYKNLEIKSFRDNKIAGKTLFAMNLALYLASQGLHCLYVSLADQNQRDMVIRASAIINGGPFAAGYANLREAYESVVKVTGSNLDISINSAGTVTATDIVERVLRDNVKCVFIDYDACLKMDSGKNSDSMYNNFGDAYNELTKLSMAGVLVFICSQPKVGSWQAGQNGGIISLGDLSDSSRKAHIADVVLTISRISGEDTPHNIFLIKLVKARRGKTIRGFFYRSQARFIEIPRGLAEQLRMDTGDQEYTDQQILAMAERYKQQEQNIQQSIKQEQKQRHDNPFS